MSKKHYSCPELSCQIDIRSSERVLRDIATKVPRYHVEIPPSAICHCRETGELEDVVEVGKDLDAALSIGTSHSFVPGNTLIWCLAVVLS